MNLHRYFILGFIFIGSLIYAGCDSIFLNEQSLDRTQWIKHAAGVEQCVPYEFASIQEALNELREANIDVLSSKKWNSLYESMLLPGWPGVLCPHRSKATVPCNRYWMDRGQ